MLPVATMTYFSGLPPGTARRLFASRSSRAWSMRSRARVRVRRERDERPRRPRGPTRRGRAPARRRGAPAASCETGGAGEQRATEEVRDAAPEEPRLRVAIDGEVHERRALIVDAVDAVRAQDRALDADRRVGVDVALHVVGDGRRKLAAPRDLLLVHGHGQHRHVHLPHAWPRVHPSSGGVRRYKGRRRAAAQNRSAPTVATAAPATARPRSARSAPPSPSRSALRRRGTRGRRGRRARTSRRRAGRSRPARREGAPRRPPASDSRRPRPPRRRCGARTSRPPRRRGSGAETSCSSRPSRGAPRAPRARPRSRRVVASRLGVARDLLEPREALVAARRSPGSAPPRRCARRGSPRQVAARERRVGVGERRRPSAARPAQAIPSASNVTSATARMRRAAAGHWKSRFRKTIALSVSSTAA